MAPTFLRCSADPTGRCVTRRTVLLAGCVLTLAVPVRGQEFAGPIARAAAREAALATRDAVGNAQSQHSPDHAWSAAVRGLVIDTDVRVMLDDGTTVRGRFGEADEQSLTLYVAGAARRIARARVQRVSIANGTRERRNRFIGIALSSVAAAWLLERHCRGKSYACREEAMLFYLPFTAAGMGLAHILPRIVWRDIYVRA